MYSTIQIKVKSYKCIHVIVVRIHTQVSVHKPSHGNGWIRCNDDVLGISSVSVRKVNITTAMEESQLEL